MSFKRTSISFVGIIGLSLWGCFPSTKYRSFDKCDSQLLPHNKVIFYYKSDTQCETCFDAVERVFKKHGIELIFIPAEEYNFRKAGILNPLDSQYYNVLYKKGITHFLIAELKGKKEKDGFFEFYAPYEAGLQDPFDPLSPYGSQVIRDNSAEATVNLSLYTIENRKNAYRLTVKTTLNSIVHKDDDGSETHYNLGDVSMATLTALQKGANRIFKKCNM